MSDNQYGDILDDEVIETPEQPAATEPKADSEGPKALRDALKKANQKIAKLEAKEREKAIADAGLPPAALELAAVQVQNIDDLPKWIEEKRGLFGVAASTTTEEVDPTAPVGQPSLSPEQVQRMRATNVQPGSFNPGGIRELDAQVNNAQSKEELTAILAQQGRLAR
jgi:hypothetical protein